MPNCFQLIDKETKVAVGLSKLDEDLCREFDQPVDSVRYLDGWFDVIGFKLACGKNYETIRKDIEEWQGDNELMLKILSYIEQRYEPSSWVEIGRRS
jgi:hypothetical protein